MNLNNFTLKAQESVQKAFDIAGAKGQQSVECAHILMGVMSEAESVTDFIVGKMGVNIVSLAKEIEKLVDSYPKVSGAESYVCLLYTSDAADEEDSVDLGGRRIIK